MAFASIGNGNPEGSGEGIGDQTSMEEDSDTGGGEDQMAVKKSYPTMTLA